MIGRALNGRYELVEILGVGGMATVWRGVDHVLGRQVAVKVLNGGLADDPRFAERFGREAQHAAMLVHPRIAMVFDSGLDQGSPYIVMELVQGRSLAVLLAQRPGLPVEQAVGIAAAVCEGLAHAHAAGLVHRDIKPGNIMITHDGGVKVVDFGIARAGSSHNLTQTASVLGTAAYLSPEQATASALDGRTDLYAVGCVLTEMLTGAPPFAAETPVGIAYKHVGELPLPPSVRRPGLPPALDAAVLRLLAKQPADRPADAAAARAELLACVPGLVPSDPTTELLAAAFPQAAPPPADQRHTTLLPPQPAPPAPTSVMAPIPAADPFPQAEPVRESRRRPIVFGALGLAGAAGAAMLALTAFDDPSTPDATAPSARPTATAPVTPAATPTPTPTQAPVPAPTATTPSAPPPAVPTTQPPHNQAPLVQINALRQSIAQTQVEKDRARQIELLRTLDEATARLNEGHPDDAANKLKSAQRTVRDLAKRHAIEGQTYQNWNSRLSSLITSLNATADRDD
ncbi:serine/threonine protein kinase [Streptomyces sp. TLI_053]|uniref:protein kinase domain-containing protein n=1 Tax=Streptomyces sp. TLI_053 TaxID=1855352 RepID=UPI000879776F|nr:protein kinase [Streptomyces sp. TLI_053]SDT67751.1 serine/threonine protein kinase [Streptomyces sp. TLI_053]